MLNEKEITTINFDNSKRRRNMLFGIGVILFCAVFIILIISADVIKIFYLAMFVLILVITVVVLFKSAREMNSKDRVGLVLNPTGITFNGTNSARKIGQVSWIDIENFEAKEVYKTKQLYLRLKNPQKYIKEKSKIELANNGVFINATELKISFEELTSLTTNYLNRYGQASTPKAYPRKL